MRKKRVSARLQEKLGELHKETALKEGRNLDIIADGPRAVVTQRQRFTAPMPRVGVC
jgi:hypothetical protein